MVNTKERQVARSMVIQLTAEGRTLAEISKTFPDIGKSTIYRWMQAFLKDGVTDRRPKKNVKREQFREKVLYLQKQGFTVPEIVKTVKSVSSSTVYSWLREEDLQPSSKGEQMMNKTIRTVTKTTPQIKAASNQTPDEEKTREELLAELRKTKAQLQDARILNLLQGKMMEIAERDYGIEFRKKPGAKQSEKQRTRR